jgi:uncharacterized protein YdeI (YjbR/CyaY-like superfamily)
MLTLAFADQDAWLAWLEREHAESAGIWLKLAKANSGIPSITYSAALDVALCFGWIDGQKRSFDDQYWLQRFCPRTPRSRWSQINRARAEALIAAGEMRPAGQQAVDKAKADGRWAAAYASPRTAEVPDDLRRRLDDVPAAAAFFATLDSRNRYSILHRVQEAKKPETRSRRIEKFIAMLANQEKIYP